MNNKKLIELIEYRLQIIQSVFVFLFFLSGLSSLNSQTIFITDSDALYRLNLEQCTYELVIQADRNISDITFLPDGTLVGINLGRELFVIDTLTGVTTLLYIFPGQLFGALTSSLDGLIYTVDRNGEFWSFDISTGIATNLGNVGYGNGGDLAFFNGELYMSSVFDDLIIKIDIGNPSNSVVVMTNAGSDGGAMYGIVTFALDCNDVRFYGIVSGNYTILEVDLENLTTDTVCILDQLFSGAATTREFKASDPIRLLDTLITHPDCAEDNGSITVIAHGGVPPYKYSIGGGPLQDQNVFANLIPGDYNIVIVDTRGCSTEVDINLHLLEVHTIDTILITNSTCNELNGILNIIPIDTGAFQFSLNGIMYQSSGIFDHIDAGMYNVFVLNPLGCEEQRTLEVLSIPAVIITEIEIIPTSCGESNGSIEVQTQNGNTISYSIDGNTFQDDNIFDDLMSGDIFISIQDENGCRMDSMINIPASMQLSSNSIVIKNPLCGEITGSATLNITNGTGIIEFSIDGQDAQLSPLFSNLGEGFHTWIATDAMGCWAIGEFEIYLTPELQLKNISLLAADCGISNGEIEFEILNAPANIEIKLNGKLFSDTHITDLSPGTYNVQIADENGCNIDTILKIESKPCDFFIPNLFSPNGDGVNDEFIIAFPAGITGMIKKFIIHDRWGNMVFSLTDTSGNAIEIKWDGLYNGQMLNPGVYVYYLELGDGVLEQTFYKGDVTLIK